MTEVWFYHLERTPLEQALPDLLEKVVARGWNAYVHVARHQDDKINALDHLLWTYAPASFLAHGREGDEADRLQPVLLGTSGQPANAAEVFVSITPDDLPDIEGSQRCLILFEGDNDEHVKWARSQWGALKAIGHSLAYWQQSDQGRWEKKQ